MAVVDHEPRFVIDKIGNFASVTHNACDEPTARRLLRSLKEEGVLRELRPASGRRPALFGFRELVNIAEGDEVF